MHAPRPWTCLLAGLPAAIVLIVYLPATRFGFVWDDYNYLYAGAAFRDGSGVLDAALSPYLGSSAYFRPIPLLMLAVEQSLSGGSPAVSHLINILLHVANLMLVGVISFILTGQTVEDKRLPPVVGALAGMVYGLHPALVEAACWISARFDLTLTFFCLVALLLDKALRRDWIRAAAVGTCFGLAALCKESAVGFALLLPAWHLLSGPPALAMRDFLDRNLPVYSGVVLAGLAYLVLRMAILDQPGTAEGQYPYADALGHLALVMKSLGTFWMLTVWPFGMTSPVHPLVSPLRLLEWTALIGWLSVAVMIWIAWRARNGSSRHDLLLICSFLAFSPAMNILPLPIKDNFIHERFLTLPIAFASIWAGLLPARLVALGGRNTGMLLVAGVTASSWIIGSLIAIRATMPSWADDLSLWVRAYSVAPDSQTVINNLQRSLIERNYDLDARRLSEHVLQRVGLTPAQRLGYAIALNNLGEERTSFEQLQLAERLLDEGDAATAPLWAQAGWLHLMQGRLSEAKAGLALAVRLAPHASDPVFFLGVTLTAMGDGESGPELVERGLDLMHPSLAAQRLESVDALVADARLKAQTGPEAKHP